MLNAFYDYIARTSENRQRVGIKGIGYTEEEFEAFAAGWEAHENKVKTDTKIYLSGLLYSKFGTFESVINWWTSPCAELDNKIPKDIFPYNPRLVSNMVHKMVGTK